MKMKAEELSHENREVGESLDDPKVTGVPYHYKVEEASQPLKDLDIIEKIKGDHITWCL